MTAVQKTLKIKEYIETNLPALLVAAGLSPIDEYRNKTPLKNNDREICVYIDSDKNTKDGLEFSAIIQFQNSGADDVDEYHSVIFPLLEAFDPEEIEMEERMSVEADIWPLDINSSNSYAVYIMVFRSWLDTCNGGF